jgi:Protein of unknown function (DUF3592)
MWPESVKPITCLNRSHLVSGNLSVISFRQFARPALKLTARRRIAGLGGLVIDIVIAFLIKSALRLRRAWGSGKWQRVKARVDSSSLAGGWVWNCPTTELAYTYEFAGQTYSVIDTNPFLSEGSAKVELECFKPGKYALVRVDPVQPRRSVIKWADQQKQDR